MCAITGRSSTGTIGLVISYVSGRSRVPRPAARTIALIVRGAALRSVAVVVGLVRAIDRDADVGGLLIRQLRQLHAQRIQVQARDLLVEVLGQHVHLLGVLTVLREQLDLGN